MNPPCAKCSKTVYPLEKFNCLDKVWHKGCFRCSICNLALNMKTYKGYNKEPFCNAHYPQTKFTAVADTPESKRLATNTKNQSAVKYHEEFEKSRGKFTAVADDPETLRHKAQTRIISNVAYHGDLEKKAVMEQLRPAGMDNHNGIGGAGSKISPSGTSSSLKSEQIIVHTPGKPTDSVHEAKDSPYSSSKQSTVIYTSEHGAVNNPTDHKVGSIADYDPVNEKYGSIASQKAPVDNMSHVYRGQPENIMPPPQMVPPPQTTRPGTSFVAIYDYVAADDDEISFNEGDLLVDCNPIDEGWMTGTVKRTGKSGMLPANYVEISS